MFSTLSSSLWILRCSNRMASSSTIIVPTINATTDANITSLNTLTWVVSLGSAGGHGLLQMYRRSSSHRKSFHLFSGINSLQKHKEIGLRQHAYSTQSSPKTALLGSPPSHGNCPLVSKKVISVLKSSLNLNREGCGSNPPTRSSLRKPKQHKVSNDNYSESEPRNNLPSQRLTFPPSLTASSTVALCSSSLKGTASLPPFSIQRSSATEKFTFSLTARNSEESTQRDTSR